MPFDLSQRYVAYLETKAYQIDSLGRRWNPAMHPRDSKGRFIETGGIVRVGVAGGLAKVMRTLLGNKVEVMHEDGTRRVIDARQLTMVRRPDGSKPTGDARKVVKEDAVREADPNRGDGLLHDDHTDLSNLPSEDPQDEDHQAENLDNAPDVPEAYTPSRDHAEEGDWIAMAAKDKNGRTIYGMAEVTKTDGNGKATHVRLAGSKDAQGRKRSEFPGDGDGDTIIPKSDLGDPKEFEADVTRGKGQLPLDATDATDLVEVHAKPKPSKAKGPRDESGKPAPVKVAGDDLRMQTGPNGVADGSMYFLGKRVGRIYADPEVPGREKFIVSSIGGFKKQVNSFDSGREVLARHLTKLANSDGGKKPAEPKVDAPNVDAPETNAPEVPNAPDAPTLPEGVTADDHNVRYNGKRVGGLVDRHNGQWGALGGGDTLDLGDHPDRESAIQAVLKDAGIIKTDTPEVPQIGRSNHPGGGLAPKDMVAVEGDPNGAVKIDKPEQYGGGLAGFVRAEGDHFAVFDANGKRLYVAKTHDSGVNTLLRHVNKRGVAQENEKKPAPKSRPAAPATPAPAQAAPAAPAAPQNAPEAPQAPAQQDTPEVPAAPTVDPAVREQIDARVRKMSDSELARTARDRSEGMTTAADLAVDEQERRRQARAAQQQTPDPLPAPEVAAPSVRDRIEQRREQEAAQRDAERDPALTAAIAELDRLAVHDHPDMAPAYQNAEKHVREADSPEAAAAEVRRLGDSFLKDADTLEADPEIGAGQMVSDYRRAGTHLNGTADRLSPRPEPAPEAAPDTEAPAAAPSPEASAPEAPQVPEPTVDPAVAGLADLIDRDPKSVRAIIKEIQGKRKGKAAEWGRNLRNLNAKRPPAKKDRVSAMAEIAKFSESQGSGFAPPVLWKAFEGDDGSVWATDKFRVLRVMPGDPDYDAARALLPEQQEHDVPRMGSIMDKAEKNATVPVDLNAGELVADKHRVSITVPGATNDDGKPLGLNAEFVRSFPKGTQFRRPEKGAGAFLAVDKDGNTIGALMPVNLGEKKWDGTEWSGTTPLTAQSLADDISAHVNLGNSGRDALYRKHGVNLGAPDAPEATPATPDAPPAPEPTPEAPATPDVPTPDATPEAPARPADALTTPPVDWNAPVDTTRPKKPTRPAPTPAGIDWSAPENDPNSEANRPRPKSTPPAPAPAPVDWNAPENKPERHDTRPTPQGPLPSREEFDLMAVADNAMGNQAHRAADELKRRGFERRNGRWERVKPTEPPQEPRPATVREPVNNGANTQEGVDHAQGRGGVREDRGAPLDEVPAAGGGSDSAGSEGGVLREPGAASGGRRDVPGSGNRAADQPADRRSGSDSAAGSDGGHARRGGSSPRPGAAAPGQRAERVPAEPGQPDNADRTGGHGPAEHRDVTPAPQAQDFKPRSQADLGNAGSQEAQVARNMEALRTLRKVQAEKRPATPEEQATMAKFAGWGALPQVFSTGNPKYAAEREELKRLMSNDDYEEALNNTLNAHYTDASLVQPMWQALQALGFNGGDVLEAGSGSGNFIGFAPDGARMHGVEKNGVTADIAKLLYPSADIRKESFAHTTVKPGQYDAMIGNVPFSDTKLNDDEHNPGRELMMHDHFILKGVNGTKPGGIIAVVTSSGTMDKTTGDLREKIAEKADLLGAIRLPGNAHQAAAGTGVTTDIILLRVRKPGEEPRDLSWVKSENVDLGDAGGKLVARNPYFAAHPENVLGQEFTDTGRFGSGQRIGVKGDPKTAPSDALVRLHSITTAAREAGLTYDPVDVPVERKPVKTMASKRTAKKVATIAAPGVFVEPSAATKARPKKIGQITHTGTEKVAGKREGSKGSIRHTFTIVDFDGNEVEYVPDGAASAGMVPKAGSKDEGAHSQADELVDLMRMRDVLGDLQDAERQSAEDTPEIQGLRSQLSDLYDHYVSKYGPIGRTKTRRVKAKAPADPEDPNQTEGLTQADDGEWYSETQIKPPMGGARKDPTFWNVASLEKSYNEDTGTAEKADLFTKRTAGVRDIPTRADSPADALTISRELDGRVDLNRVASLLGIDPTEARGALGSLVYEDHKTGELVPAHLYLAGDTRQKLRELTALAKENPKWEGARAAMEAAVPTAKPADRITAKLGMTWIPKRDLTAFVRELTGNPKATVGTTASVAGNDLWSVSNNGRRGNLSLEGGTHMPRPRGHQGPLLARWGTGRRDTYQIIEAALRGNVPEVSDKNAEGKDVLNKEETDAAKRMAEKIQAEFNKWWRRDPERRERLTTAYNDRYRSFTEPNYVDSPMRAYEGMSDEVVLDPHQNDAVTMAQDVESMLLHHEVGTGKTYTYGAAVMELKRLGKVNKPVIVVPNHLLEQAVREFKHLYPRSNVLATDNPSLSSQDGKRRFIAQAANSDWDAVFMTKNAFAAIPLDEHATTEAIQTQLDDLRAKRDDALQEGKTADVKKWSAQIEKAEERLIELQKRLKSDVGALDFRTAGFDYVVVDEAHEYKNDEVQSSSRQLEKKKPNLQAVDLRQKLDYLRGRNAELGKNHVAMFATGTPVSNSTREFYVMLRFLRPDLLKASNVEDFDAFRKAFLTDEEQIAPGVTGKLQVKTRDGDMLVNAGELKRMWVQFADEVTADDVGIERPELKNGQGTKVEGTVSDAQKQFMAYLQVRRDNIKPKFKPEKGDDTVVAIATDALIAAVDLRLMSDEKLAAAGLHRSQLTDRDSKVSLVGDRVLDEWRRTKDNQYETFKGSGVPAEERGGFQIIFSDKGTPKSDGSYSFYDSMKSYLVRNGMKPEEVAFIHDAPDAAAVGKLMEKARQGKLKVLIGSTEKMGTGMNVQNRATLLHHVDGAYRPDQIEQRNGRVLRRGNQNAQVEIAYYPLVGSTEGFQWSHVARKDNFLRAFALADLDATVVGKPEGETASEADMLQALAADQPLLTEKISLDLALRNMESDKDSVLGSQEFHQDQIRQGTEAIRRWESDIQALNTVASTVQSTRGDKFKMTLADKFGGMENTPLTDRTKAAEALAAKLATIDTQYAPLGLDSRGWKKVGVLGGQDLYVTTYKGTQGATRFRFGIEAPGSTWNNRQMLNLDPVEHETNKDVGPGLVTKLENMVNDGIGGRIPTLEASIKHRRDQIAVSEVEKDRGYEHDAELDALRERQTALRDLMAAGDNGIQGEQGAKLENDYNAATARWRALKDTRLATTEAAKPAEMGAARTSRRKIKQQISETRRADRGETLPTRRVRTEDASDATTRQPTESTPRDPNAEPKVRGPRNEDTTPRVRVPAAADGTPDVAATPEPVDTTPDATPDTTPDATPAPAAASGDAGDGTPPVDTPPTAAAGDPQDNVFGTGMNHDQLMSQSQQVRGGQLQPGDLVYSQRDNAWRRYKGTRQVNGSEVGYQGDAADRKTKAHVYEDANGNEVLEATGSGNSAMRTVYRPATGAQPDAAPDSTPDDTVRVPARDLPRPPRDTSTSDTGGDRPTTSTDGGGRADTDTITAPPASPRPERDLPDGPQTPDEAAADTVDRPAATGGLGNATSGGSTLADGSPAPSLDEPTRDPANYDENGMGRIRRGNGAVYVDTALGEANVVRGNDGLWHLTYPGEQHPDDSYGTQREALAGLRNWMRDNHGGPDAPTADETSDSTVSVAPEDLPRAPEVGAPEGAMPDERTDDQAEAAAVAAEASDAATDDPSTPEERDAADKERVDAARADAEQAALAEGASKAEANRAGEAAAADEATADADLAAARPIPPAPVSQDHADELDYQAKTPTQLEGEKYPLTTQQQKVADAVVADGKDTKVEAKAGSGKTSTLEAIARRFLAADPKKRIAYIAFNKSVQVEAEGRMPGNTEARTGHSIAFAWRGKKWTDRKFKSPTALRRADEIANHLGIRGDLGEMDPAQQAQAVMRAVGKYANSADDTIQAKHFEGMNLSDEDAKKLLGYAKKAWADLESIDGKINVNNDHIRKMWALSRPDFSKPGSGLKTPAHVLFLDEAQDTPPVLAKVVADQSIQKVIVGDADQAIYGFTGATDYLSTAKADVALPLTKSWRFGPAIADMGNRFLQVLGSKDRVIGGGAEGRIVNDMQGADAILVRSNGGMIGEIVREQEAGRIVGVPKGTKADLLSLVESARYLKGEGRAPSVMHEDLAMYRTWDEFVAAATDEQNPDPKARMLYNIISAHGLDGLERIISQVRELDEGGLAGAKLQTLDDRLVLTGAFMLNSRVKERTGEGMGRLGWKWDGDAKSWTATGTPEQREAALAKLREAIAGEKPDVVVSTAHKAKGLEWGRVRIGDDFRGPEEDKNTGELRMPDPEELKLAYVAVTRAEKELDPGSLGWVLAHSNPNGEGDRTNPDAPTADVTPNVDTAAVTPNEDTVRVAPEDLPRTPTVDTTPDGERIDSTNTPNVPGGAPNGPDGAPGGTPGVPGNLDGTGTPDGANAPDGTNVPDGANAPSGTDHTDGDNVDASTGLEDAPEADLVDLPSDTPEQRDAKGRERRRRRRRHHRNNPLNNVGDPNDALNNLNGVGLPDRPDLAAPVAGVPGEGAGRGAGDGTNAPGTPGDTGTVSVGDTGASGVTGDTISVAPGDLPTPPAPAATNTPDNAAPDATPLDDAEQAARDRAIVQFYPGNGTDATIAHFGLANADEMWAAHTRDQERQRAAAAERGRAREAWEAGRPPADAPGTADQVQVGDVIRRGGVDYRVTTSESTDRGRFWRIAAEPVDWQGREDGTPAPEGLHVSGIFGSQGGWAKVPQAADTPGGYHPLPTTNEHGGIDMPAWMQHAATPEGVATDGAPQGAEGYYVRNLTDSTGELVGPDGAVKGTLRHGVNKKGEPQWVGVLPDGTEVAWAAEPFHAARSLSNRAYWNDHPAAEKEMVPEAGAPETPTDAPAGLNLATIPRTADDHGTIRLPAGMTAPTAGGRTTTPFPRTDFSTPRKATNSRGRVDDWLLENAKAEADVRGINHMLPARGADMTPAERDMAERILFDPSLRELDGSARPSRLRPLGGRDATPDGESDTPSGGDTPDVAAESATPEAQGGVPEQAASEAAPQAPGTPETPASNVPDGYNPERWAIPEPERAGNGQITKTTAARALNHAAQAAASDDDKAALHHARRALLDTGWAADGGPEGQGASLANVPQRVLDKIGETREGLDARIAAHEALADHLDRAEFGGKPLGGMKIAKAKGDEPTLSDYLRRYAAGYRAARAEQEPTGTPDTPANVATPDGVATPSDTATPAVATPDVTPNSDTTPGTATTTGAAPGEWAETDGVSEAEVPGQWRAEVYPEGDGYSWAVHYPDGTVKMGTAPTMEEGRASARADVASRAAATANTPATPTTMAMSDVLDAPDEADAPDAADVPDAPANEDTPAAADTAAPAEETAAPVINGEQAGWVPTGDLQPGDIAQVSGDNGNGSATTRTGHVLGTPESVEVHEPGKEPAGGHRVTVGEDRSGMGDRGTVLSAEDDMAARAERDKNAADTSNPESVPESNILGHQTGEAIPTDRNGLGLYPGSKVSDRSHTGTIRETGDNEVTVRWDGEHRDRTVQPGTLSVDESQHVRPAGWNKHGQLIRNGKIVENADGKRGPVEHVDGDTVGFLTPEGMVYEDAANLKVIGQVRDGESGVDDLRESVFDAPVAPEGMDVRPTDPIKPDDLPDGVTGALVNLKPEQLAAFNDLGLDTDQVSPYDVQQAAARIRHGLPISTEQATALSEHLRALLDNGGLSGGQARALRRVANRVDAAGARGRGEDVTPETPEAAAPERVQVADVAPGDVIAVPDVLTGQVTWGRVITKEPKVVRDDGTINPQIADTMLELGNGDRIKVALDQNSEVYRLPDMPDDESAVQFPGLDTNRPFAEPRVAERMDDAVDAVVDAAVGGDTEHTSIEDLAADAAQAMDDGADHQDQRNAADRLETSLGHSGVDEEHAAQVHDAAEAVADQVANDVADTVLNTVADAEPLPGESAKDAAQRVKDLIREHAHDAIDRDGVVDQALNGETPRTDAERAAAHAETIDAMRADLFAMADEIARQGDLVSANALSEVAARLAGRPDPIQVERAVRALTVGRKAAGPSLRARVVAAFQRARARFLDAIKRLMGTGRRARMSLKAAIAAAKSEWNGDDHAGEVTDLVDHAASTVERATVDGLTPGEPQDFAGRMQFWREQLPENPADFGRVPGRRSFGQLTLDALRGGRTLRGEENPNETRLDRAADGGPGEKATKDTQAVSGLGGALSDEVDARVRAAHPDLGSDPAATVREARRYAKSLAGEHRGNPDDGELDALRQKAKADADDKAKRYADALAEHTLAVLREAREMGPVGDAKVNIKGRSQNAEEVKALRWAEQHFPTDWLTAAGTVEAQAGRMSGYRDDGTITVAPLGESHRDGAGEYGKSAAQGLARHMETVIPGLREGTWAYHWNRTSSGDVGRRTRRGRNALGRLTNLFPAAGVGREQVARPGDFPDPWMGQEYDGEQPSWWPIALDSLFTGGQDYLDDQMRRWVMGALAYYERNKR